MWATIGEGRRIAAAAEAGSGATMMMMMMMMQHTILLLLLLATLRVSVFVQLVYHQVRRCSSGATHAARLDVFFQLKTSSSSKLIRPAAVSTQGCGVFVCVCVVLMFLLFSSLLFSLSKKSGVVWVWYGCGVCALMRWCNDDRTDMYG